jgi:hypothetical protein
MPQPQTNLITMTPNAHAGSREPPSKPSPAEAAWDEAPNPSGCFAPARYVTKFQAIATDQYRRGQHSAVPPDRVGRSDWHSGASP